MEKGNTAFLGRGLVLWLLCTLLGDVAFPEVGGFELNEVFRAAAVPLLLMIAGFSADEKDSLRTALGKSAGAGLGYVLIRAAACLTNLAVELIFWNGYGETVILKNAIRDTLWGFAGTGEGTVGGVWILACMVWTFPMLWLVFRLKKNWLRFFVVLAAGAAGMVLRDPAGQLPWALEAATLCLVFLYGGWALRKYRVPERLAASRWWLVLIPGWCFAGFDGALDIGLGAWPHNVVSLIPAFCGGVLLLLAARQMRWAERLGQLAAKHFLLLFAAWYLVTTCYTGPENWEPAAVEALRWGLFVLLCACTPWLRKLRVLLERHEQGIFLILMAAMAVEQYALATAIDLRWPYWYEPVIRMGLLVMALCKLRRKVSEENVGKWILPVLIGAAFIGSFLNTGYLFLLDLSLLIFCAGDVPYKRILRVHFGVVMCTFAVIFTASLIGICPNVGAPRGDGWRYFFGSGGPTDFAAHMVFLALTYWVMKDRVPVLGLIGTMAASVVFQIYLTDTRCSEIILILACMGVAYIALIQKWQDEALVRRMNGLLDGLGRLVMPICAVLIIAMSLRYDADSAHWQWLNNLTSNRLSLTKAAFQQYGVKIFGTVFDLVGVGMGDAARANYNFVDSSYCLILIRYGLAPLLATLALCGLVQKKAAACGNRKLVIAFMLVAAASVIEHHLLDVFYNPFILLPFADFGEEKQEVQGWSRERLVRQGVSLTVTAAMALGVPQLILYAQTVVTVARGSAFYSQWLACTVLLAVLLLIFGLWNCLVNTASRWILGGKFPARKAGGLTAVLAVLILGGLGAEMLVQKNAAQYRPRIEDAKKLVSLLEENGVEANIITDEVPILYRREMDGITPRLLPAATAADVENAVVLTNGLQDYRRLSNAGFVYVPISEGSALYTNSSGAMALLEELGYEMHSYCDALIPVDLRDMARRNGLPYTEDGTVLMDGEGNPMKRGPYIHLYYGTYRVTFRIKVLYASIEEGPLGTVETSSEWGTADLTVVPFTWEDVDEHGRVTMVVDSLFPNREQIEFSVRPWGDALLEVESITYQRIK